MATLQPIRRNKIQVVVSGLSAQSVCHTVVCRIGRNLYIHIISYYGHNNNTTPVTTNHFISFNGPKSINIIFVYKKKKSKNLIRSMLLIVES